MSLLDPYRPDVDGPWGRRQAGHLLRRAGFCAPAEAIDAAMRAGPRATVARFLDDAAANDRTAVESSRYSELDGLGDAIAARGDIEQLAAWWLMRMQHTARPLHARLAVMWHNHFATSNRKVASPPLMLQQLRTIEAHALGRFEPLLLAMSRDPAMIVWLDGDSNRKGKPNENYARELFELFSLGPGSYSEADIREAARAFSGWHQKSGCFAFNARLHDDGDKGVLGRSGPLGGEDVVAVAVEQPACPRFVAARLAREFVSDEPPDDLVVELAAVLRENDLDIAATLRQLLASRAMFEPRSYRARVKSPVEFCIGLLRSFDMSAPGKAVHEAASQMGQRLFEPPTVKGWDGGRRWINAATMLVRMNTASAAAAGEKGFGLDAERWVASAGRDDASGAEATGADAPRADADAVDFAIGVMLDGEVAEDVRAALRANCKGSAAQALRAALAAIGSSPEYQLG